MIRNIKSKKGDTPITILVIGVIAICMLAILTFYLSNRSVKKGFDIETVETAAIMGEKIAFYRENLGFSESEINEIFGVKQDPLGKHIILEQEGISVRYNIP